MTHYHGVFPPQLTLRDYFAGQAILSLLASKNYHINHVRLTANEAYKIADAMLAERVKAPLKEAE